MHCKKHLQWFDMVPLASWVALRGKCRYCGAKISIQYPLVEAATGIIFALIGGAGLPLLVIPFALAAAALLVCIFVYDLYHTIIPDVWVWPFCILAFAFSLFSTNYQLPTTNYLLAGPAAASILFALWLVSRGAWMGFGDVKLALGMGWLLGFPAGIVAVFFGFVLGAATTVPLLMWGKLRAGSHGGLTMKSEVPFGPFLIASTCIIWFALLYNIPIPIFSQI